MQRDAVFILDSSYSATDVALPIDDQKPHIAVSNRRIDPPPGHRSLLLEEEKGPSSVLRNLRLLRAEWRERGGGKCIVIAVSWVRPEQQLFNAIYALSLSRRVVFFDGTHFLSIYRYSLSLLRCAVLAAARFSLWDLKLRLEKFFFDRRVRTLPAISTKEGELFGLYTSDRSFSLTPDEVTLPPDGRSVYGEISRGWYLPAFSARRQRYAVRTTRQYLHDVTVHVERMKGFEVSCLIKEGRILDYPYMLGRSRRWYSYPVSDRGAVKTVERGINLLAYTSTYYHWLVEGVPRILDVIDDGFDFDLYPLLLPPLDPFQRQVLEVLGIDPDRQTISVDIGEWCHVGECVFPTANFPFGTAALEDPSGQPDRALLMRIRERLLDRLTSTTFVGSATPSRIYISRERAGRRKFTAATEVALTSLLESVGFVKVCLEDLAWPAQVRLVAGAEYIVGLHGAGLTNILFANAKALLEFHNPLQARPYFAVMARELDVKYAYIIGSIEGNSPDFNNITIDLRTVRQMLGRIIVPEIGSGGSR